MRCLALWLAMAAYPTWAAEPASMNGRRLGDWDGQAVTFLAIGHAYGAAENGQSIHPAATLLASLDRINAIEPAFVALLGDNARRPTDEQLDALSRSVLERIQAPVFNAVGNHDMLDRPKYEGRFGRTFFRFAYGPAMFVFLDTEIDQGQIAGEQETMLCQAIAEAQSRDDLAALALFMHKPLHFIGDPHFADLLALVNAPSGYPKETNFRADFMSRLMALAESKAVLLVADDVGVSWSFPFAYETREGRMHCVTTGLGDSRDDCAVQITVARDQVRVQPVSLAGRDDLTADGHTAADVVARLRDRPKPAFPGHGPSAKWALAMGAAAASVVWVTAMALLWMARKPRAED